MKTQSSRQRPLMQDPRAVRRRRVLAGLSKARLAKAAGISTSHISNIELGQRSTSEDVLHRLAQALDCPVEELISEELMVK